MGDMEMQQMDRAGGPGDERAAFARRSARLVHAAVALAVVLSWLLLGAMAIRAARSGPLAGPGSGLLEALSDIPLPSLLESFVRLCVSPAPLEAGAARLAGLLAMWFLMALAMMLPSATPMIRTYHEITETAAAKGEAAVHPAVLVLGYLAVWLAASVVAAALTMAVSAGLAPLREPAAAAALAVAGLYQFSALKDACLRKCGNPFATLFSRWSARPGRIFRLGAEQGLWCLGCCWALMLVMFAVGVMNVFWMALLALFTMAEKQSRGRRLTRCAGVILLVWAAALLVVSLAK